MLKQSEWRMSKINPSNLEHCVQHGDSKVIIDLVTKYFENKKLSASYIIEPVCTEGLSRLYCGYFRGAYGLIEIERVGLYPAEIEDIENKLLPVIQTKITNVPRVRGALPFAFEKTASSVILRFYAKVSDEEQAKENIIEIVNNELAPVLELVARFLKKETDIYF